MRMDGLWKPTLRQFGPKLDDHLGKLIFPRAPFPPTPVLLSRPSPVSEVDDVDVVWQEAGCFGVVATK